MSVCIHIIIRAADRLKKLIVRIIYLIVVNRAINRNFLESFPKALAKLSAIFRLLSELRCIPKKVVDNFIILSNSVILANNVEIICFA